MTKWTNTKRKFRLDNSSVGTIDEDYDSLDTYKGGKLLSDMEYKRWVAPYINEIHNRIKNFNTSIEYVVKANKELLPMEEYEKSIEAIIDSYLMNLHKVSREIPVVLTSKIRLNLTQTESDSQITYTVKFFTNHAVNPTYYTQKLRETKSEAEKLLQSVSNEDLIAELGRRLNAVRQSIIDTKSIQKGGKP